MLQKQTRTLPANTDSHDSPDRFAFANSPVTHHTFQGHTFYLKRDELLHPEFSGNKARKFMSLLTGSFPDVTHLISYGSPQANSLYSLAALARLKNWQLEYYVDHIPGFLQQHPSGNYKAALSLGASVIPTNNPQAGFLHPEQYISQKRLPADGCLFVPEGGRCELAKEGVMALADELLGWIEQNRPESPVIALPSGTGTTALYIHQVMQQHQIPVLTCACVGGTEYLLKQFQSLGADSYPQILSLPEKHHFGKLYREDYQLWRQLCHETGVEFELLYDPLMWRCLMQWLPQHQASSLIYIHQGGLKGNESMLPRYQRKYPDL